MERFIAREAKAKRIVSKCVLRKIDEHTWIVPSQTKEGVEYKVETLLWESCTCADFRRRRKPCKHIIAVRLIKDKEGQR